MLPEFVVYINIIMQLRVFILLCRLTEQPGIVDGRRQHCQLDAAGAQHSKEAVLVHAHIWYPATLRSMMRGQSCSCAGSESN